MINWKSHCVSANSSFSSVVQFFLYDCSLLSFTDNSRSQLKLSSLKINDDHLSISHFLRIPLHGCFIIWPLSTGGWRMNPGELWTVWSVPSIFLQGNRNWHRDTNGRCIVCIAYQQWNQSLVTCTKTWTSFHLILHKFACISTFFFRQHKDIALVNMANVLHRAHFSADAAILAHAALDLTTDLLTSHYTLGNIYAVSAALWRRGMVSWKYIFKMFLSFIIIICVHTFCWAEKGTLISVFVSNDTCSFYISLLPPYLW